jgi:hypothetical protein
MYFLGWKNLIFGLAFVEFLRLHFFVLAFIHMGF